MKKAPFLAPGCFGSALLFQKTNMVCTACPFAESCEPVHQENLDYMRDHLGIVVPKQVERETIEPDETCMGDPGRMVLPVKVRKLLQKVDELGLNISEMMKKNQNPFQGTNLKFMEVVAHIIIRMKAPVTRPVLVAALSTHMDWRHSTAQAHARMAVQALVYVGAIQDNDGIFSVQQ